VKPLKPFYANRPNIKVSVAQRPSGPIVHVIFKLESIKHINFKTTSLDKLWLNTCFETFEFDNNSDQYVEWNFNANGEAKTYLFSSYRKQIKQLNIDLHTKASTYDNSFKLSVDLPKFFKNSTLKNTTVIKLNNNSYNYYAESHPLDKPDFHKA